jgi:hypothetical protein
VAELLVQGPLSSGRAKDFVLGHFEMDMYDSAGIEAALSAGMNAERGDGPTIHRRLVSLARRTEARWEFLLDCYAAEYGGVDPARLEHRVRTWAALDVLSSSLRDETVSRARKEAILRLIPLMDEFDSWHFFGDAVESCGDDERLGEVLVGLIGGTRLGPDSEVRFMDRLFTPGRVADLVEAHYRRLPEGSRLLAFLRERADTPCYAGALIRLAPNVSLVTQLSSEEFASGDLLAALRGVRFPAGTRVGYSYPGPWDEYGPVRLEVRCPPEHGEEASSLARAALAEHLDEASVDARVSLHEWLVGNDW